jgi:hypothetical protein
LEIPASTVPQAQEKTCPPDCGNISEILGLCQWLQNRVKQKNCVEIAQENTGSAHALK